MLRCSLALLALAAPALADEIHVESITANDLAVRDLRCTLEEGGSLATLQVVATLAQSKRSLDACAPGGGAYRVRWEWAGGGAGRVEVQGGNPAGRSTCVAGVLKATKSEQVGHCEAIVLVGKPAPAAKAADGLAAASPTKKNKKARP